MSFVLAASIAAAVSAAIMIMCIRTLLLRSRQVTVEPPAFLPLAEEEVAGRLSRAVQFRTVSGETGPVDPDQFVALYAFLSESFPLVHSALKIETVNRYSRLYEWTGYDAALDPVLLLAHMDVVEPGS